MVGHESVVNMNVLLIDADQGKFPNLALMKISAYHKQKGDNVGFNTIHPDRVYISVVFEWNRSNALGVKRMYELQGMEVIIGGTGYDYKVRLPEEIEYIMPDYDLYGVDYGMGFTSRGCIRRCTFCVVPKKEGYIRHNQYVWEFLPDDFKKVILLDNNFLASPAWKENIEYLIEHGIKVNFNQGLDIRLINEENAKYLAEVKYYDWKFKSRRLYFAWDWIGLEREVMRGIHILLDAGVPARHLMFYVLVGFNTTIEQDLYRIQKLKELGVKPYVMVYNKYENKNLKILKSLQRWVNRRYYEFIEWDEYNK